jgi:uncharacterized protein YbaA (DUF1428 family)
MSYFDGFIAAVPLANKQAFTDHASAMAKVFKRHGALRVVDCWQDDIAKGKTTDFFMAVKATEDEAVSIGFIEWPSKAARDAGWEKCMKDPEMQPDVAPMPFDGKRLVYGGFTVVSDV